MKQLSIEQARELYSLGGKSKEIAIEIFPELGERKLPKTWEEFYESNKPIHGDLIEVEIGIRPAFQALNQLYLLKQEYNGYWVADWADGNLPKSCLFFRNGFLVRNYVYTAQVFLVFKSDELCEQFEQNFKELIEAAKPLLG